MTDSFSRWVNEVEASDAFAVEQATLRAAEEIYAALERAGISRADLARRLGTSAAYVTKILRGHANFTLASLAKLAHALEGEIKLHIAPNGSRTRWIDAPFTISEGDTRFSASVRIGAPDARRPAKRPASPEIMVDAPLQRSVPIAPSLEDTDGDTTSVA